MLRVKGGTGGRRVRMVLSSTFLAAGALTGPFGPTAVAQEASARQNEFHIAAQPLGDALVEFGRQSGLEITADPSLIAGKRSAEVSGRFAAGAALSRLLAGTGLTFRYISATGVTLEKAPQGADGSIQLGPVRVEGATGSGAPAAATASGAATEGTGSYTTSAMATATKLPLSIRETPQSVSVITRQQMEDQNLTNLIEAIANTPGVSITYADSDRAWFKSRGFSISNFQSDGITIDYNGSYSAGEDRFDTAIYDRIEVVRGSTGLLTGSGNPSATINLIRKQADRDDFAGTAELAAGSWNDFRGMIDLQSPLGYDGAVRGRIVAAYQDKESWLNYYHSKKLVLFGTLGIDITPDTLLTLSADYQDNDPKGTGWGGNPLWTSDGERLDLPRSFNMGARWTSWQTTSKTALAKLEHSFDGNWNLRATYSHSRNELDARLLWARGYPDAGTGEGLAFSPSRYSGHRDQDGADVSLTGKFQLFGAEHDVNAGYAYREASGTYYAYESNGTNPIAVSNFFLWDGVADEPAWGGKKSPSETRVRQYGFYGVLRLSLADTLKLIAGGRQSNYKDRTDGNEFSQNVFTPYAGLVWDFTPNLSAYVSYTDIFNPQNYRDRNGAKLDPVSGNTAEFGIKGEWFDGRLNASAALFEINQDNVAEADEGYYVPGSNPLAEAYIGVDGVRSRGFEVQVAGEVLPGWNITASWSHHHTKGDDDGDAWSTSQPSDVVHLFTNAQVTGRLALGGGLDWQSNDWCMCSGPEGSMYVETGSYALINLMGRYDISDRLTLQANIRNLLDKTYYSQIGFYSRGTYGPPRNATATLRYKF